MGRVKGRRESGSKRAELTSAPPSVVSPCVACRSPVGGVTAARGCGVSPPVPAGWPRSLATTRECCCAICARCLAISALAASLSLSI